MERFKFAINIPADVLLIHGIFKNQGLELLLVGGCVRDSIIGSSIKDWDLVTNANPDEVERLLNSTHKNITFNTIPTGKQFGVINVFTTLGGEFEIATFRSDGVYSDSRKPDSVTFGTIEEDAQRRDLTMNSLYYDLNTFEVLDFNGGLDDIRNKVIRTVGDPVKRFNEDRLRILRSIRFANRFRFRLDSELEALLNTNLELTGVSNERIRMELLSTLKTAKNKHTALLMFAKFNLLDKFFFGLEINLKKIGRVVGVDELVTIAFILRNNSLGNLDKILNNLTYSSDQVNAIVFLVSLLDFTPENIILFKKRHANVKLTSTQIKSFGKITELHEKTIKSLINFKLSVDGNAVMKEFNLKGIDLGKKISELEVENFKNMVKSK